MTLNFFSYIITRPDQWIRGNIQVNWVTLNFFFIYNNQTWQTKIEGTYRSIGWHLFFSYTITWPDQRQSREHTGQLSDTYFFIYNNLTWPTTIEGTYRSIGWHLFFSYTITWPDQRKSREHTGQLSDTYFFIYNNLTWPRRNWEHMVNWVTLIFSYIITWPDQRQSREHTGQLVDTYFFHI